MVKTETVNLWGRGDPIIDDAYVHRFGPVIPEKCDRAVDPIEAIKGRTRKSTADGPLIISPYLDKQAKLWVWDWDNTLIDIAAYERHSMDPEYIRRVLTDSEILRDVPSATYFQKLVLHLVQTGRRVGIASFGTYTIIRAYMDRIFGMGQHLFDAKNILATCPDIGCQRSCLNQPLNKNAYILKLMKHYKIENTSSVVLFDDMPSNIADALRIGCLTFHIEPATTGLFGAQTMLYIEGGLTSLCTRETTESIFGSLGDRKRWKYEAQANADILNRTLKPTRGDIIVNQNDTQTSSNAVATNPSREGFKDSFADTCVTCRAGTDVWVIGIILFFFIALFAWAAYKG
jgi:hypothetical protein